MQHFSVQANRISKSFGKVHALSDLSISFPHGQMHGVIGPEGAGKTTLLRILMGLLKPQAGEVSFSDEGESIAFEDVRDIMAYMPQRQSLYADLSIHEHLEFFKSMYGLPAEVYKERRRHLLELTRLAPFVDRPAGKLSGGMYKKLGLMCALLYSPKILILDEPTNGVDPISRRELWELLYEFLKTEMLIIITTSYMDEAERCGNVHLIQHGSLVASGEPGELLDRFNAKSFDDIFLGHASVKLS